MPPLAGHRRNKQEQMQRQFRTFIGVDLGGGKGKTTAVARLRVEARAGHYELAVEDCGGNGKAPPWYDERLLEYLLRYQAEAVVAMDAPLSLTACVRCTLPSCPTVSRCDVPTVKWFRDRQEAAQAGASGKPKYTPYTQRATEVVLHEDHGIMPRETLGQGMGPLTARMAYLRHALQGAYTLNHNLLEVYPKATLMQLFPDPVPPASVPPTKAGSKYAGIKYKDHNGQVVGLDGMPKAKLMRSQAAQQYKRSGHALQMREKILAALSADTTLRFCPGQWREVALQSDHQFDALLCAYTAFLWAKDGWQLPAEPVFAEDGWIWFPPKRQP